MIGHNNLNQSWAECTWECNERFFWDLKNTINSLRFYANLDALLSNDSKTKAGTIVKSSGHARSDGSYLVADILIAEVESRNGDTIRRDSQAHGPIMDLYEYTALFNWYVHSPRKRFWRSDMKCG